jgi:hypothetical protein
MILDTKQKQPVEVKDYPIDYSEWLGTVNDTIVSVDAQVVCLSNPDDAALVVRDVYNSTTAVVVWLSGGTDREKYKVSITVTTAGGRVDQSEFIVKVKDH